MHVRTRTRAILVVAPAALVLAAAAACSSAAAPSTGATTPATTTTSAGPAAGSSSSSAALMVTSSQSLGQIVTTGAGNTVYRYDADTSNPSKSNCTGGCATAWPPVLAGGSGAPTVSGISAGTVGEVTRADGSKQVTLDGWPLYTFAGDSGPGSVAGQGSGGNWWAVTPTGAKAGSSTGGTPSSTGTTSGGSIY